MAKNKDKLGVFGVGINTAASGRCMGVCQWPPFCRAECLGCSLDY